MPERTKNRSNKPEGFDRSFEDGAAKPPTWAQNLRQYFAQYCGASSIHGVQYIGERGRFIIEKLIWSVILLGVWFLCIMLIVKAYNKWVTSPVIVTFATTETAISKIPFPAITICPEVKSDPQIFNYTDVLLKKVGKAELTDDQIRKFQIFSLICTGIDKEIVKWGYLEHGNLTLDKRMIDDLAEAYPKHDNKLDLKWLGQEYNSEEILTETVSSSGLCYSFNMLHYSEILNEYKEYTNLRSLNNTKARNWSLKNGYRDGSRNDTFPRRTFMSGSKGGFESLFLTNHSHLDHLCGESLQGYQVTLHHPSELPNMDQHFRVPLDQAVFIAIKPRMITASEALSSYKPEDRKCYLDDEKHLRFFKHYTQQNCLDECLSNYTLSKCGCVEFYMPKLAAFPICGPRSRYCLEKTKVNYVTNQEADCSCLPSCVSLEYDIEISQTDWNWRGLFQVLSRINDKYNKSMFDFEMTHLTKVAVYYKEMQFLTSERNELYGYVDFFSNTGGLLGLFIGVSVTSLIEIIYFLTLRLTCNISRFGRDFWSGDAELIKANVIRAVLLLLNAVPTHTAMKVEAQSTRSRYLYLYVICLDCVYILILTLLPQIDRRIFLHIMMSASIVWLKVSQSTVSLSRQMLIDQFITSRK